MSRLTDNDKHFGPFTYARTDWKNTSIKWCSADPDGPDTCYVIIYMFGWVVRFFTPNWLKMDKRWVTTSTAHGGYWDETQCEYGFSLHEGHLSIYYGRQTHDSSTEKRWSCFLPWTQWRFTRYALYDKNLKLVYEWGDGRYRDWEVERLIKEATEKVPFTIIDYDGERIAANTIIEEREWKFGTGWFKWLSLFRRKTVRRSLEMSFGQEVGRDKGTWKGGVMGTGIDMLPGESRESAFKRWCEMEHRSKNGKYKVTYGG